MLGLNGAPAHPVRNAILFGAYDLTAVWHGIATAPIFGRELSLPLSKHRPLTVDGGRASKGSAAARTGRRTGGSTRASANVVVAAPESHRMNHHLW